MRGDDFTVSSRSYQLQNLIFQIYILFSLVIWGTENGKRDELEEDAKKEFLPLTKLTKLRKMAQSMR